jgi:c-di-GMP-binding flagellar brake protein YcgR
MVLWGFSWTLLQVKYFKDDDPTAGIVLVVGLGGFLLFLLINGLIKSRKGARSARRFSGFTMHKIATSYGLDKTQRKVLEEVFRDDAVSDPLEVMQSIPLLDKHFKRAYRRIENSTHDEALAQRQIALLFSTRNVIEAAQNTTATATSSRQIPANMAAVLSAAKETYPVRVLNAKGDSVLVECPKNALGTPIKFPVGSRVSLSFFTKSSKGYAFDSKILGAQDSVKGPTLKLAHAVQIKSLVQRRFRRRQTSDPCVFFMVSVKEVKVGRKVERKMTIDNRRFTGTLMDISIGGCSMRTSANIQPGSRLKIEFEYHGTPTLAVLGQVLRINKGGRNTTVHIKFVKVPPRAQNSINALVFEYADD